MGRSAWLDIVRTALVAPETIDSWPADAADLTLDPAWRLVISTLVQMRTRGAVSAVGLAAALPEADAQALSMIDLTGEPLSRAAISAAWKTIRSARPRPPKPTVQPTIEHQETEDLLNARRLVEWAEGKFIIAYGIWYHWDGKRWAYDAGSAIYELAAGVARSWLQDAAQETRESRQKALIKHAMASQKAGRIESMVSLAGKAFAELKRDPALLDADPWLLNCENGTLDLRTGELRPHDPVDMITKLAPVAYDQAALAPRFKLFLGEILSEDLIPYVQRAAGYSLTGSVREHCFFLLVGAGRNGKGVLLRSLMRIMGDYAVTAPMDLLVVKNGSEHPTELASLDSARLVMASELPPKGRWNEPRLKQLTGGDPIRARRMREDFFDLRVALKLWIATNERPRAIGSGDALWERLKEIRFGRQFRDIDDPRPERQCWPVKDPTLDEALTTELPGILRWAVEGCLQWQEQGLGEPPEVRTATAEYRAEEDRLGPFLDEHPVIRPVKLRDLFQQWCDYAKGVNEEPGKLRGFGADMRARGYEVRKGTAGAAHVYPVEVQMQMPRITTNGTNSISDPVTMLIPDSQLNAHGERAYAAQYGNASPDGHCVTNTQTGENSSFGGTVEPEPDTDADDGWRS